MLSVCEKDVSAFSCNSEVLQYQKIILLLIHDIFLFIIIVIMLSYLFHCPSLCFGYRGYKLKAHSIHNIEHDLNVKKYLINIDIDLERQRLIGSIIISIKKRHQN